MYRNRLLAAFAVTVGRDRSAADLLGLPEREVRSARRVVGKSRARTVAGDMLDLDTPTNPDENRWRASGRAAEWSKELDIALTTGWHQGVDLHVLAAQIGTDVASIVARLKELSTQGMLRGNGEAAERRGRHRKQGEAARADPAPAGPYQQSQQSQQSQQQPAPPRTVHREVTDSWVAWETQLSPGPDYYSTEGAVGGVVLEGDVWSPSQYNPY